MLHRMRVMQTIVVDLQVSVSRSVCLSCGVGRWRMQCVGGHLVQPLPNDSGLFVLLFGRALLPAGKLVHFYDIKA